MQELCQGDAGTIPTHGGGGVAGSKQNTQFYVFTILQTDEMLPLAFCCDI